MPNAMHARFRTRGLSGSSRQDTFRWKTIPKPWRELWAGFFPAISEEGGPMQVVVLDHYLKVAVQGARRRRVPPAPAVHRFQDLRGHPSRVSARASASPSA